MLSKEEQVKRIQQILSKPEVNKCQCGLNYVPFNKQDNEFCPRCGTAQVDRFEDEEEFEMIIEEVSFEESEL